MHDFNVDARHMKAARALLGWTADDLADASDVGIATIRRLEGASGTAGRLTVDVYRRLISAFAKAGIQFSETGVALVVEKEAA